MKFEKMPDIYPAMQLWGHRTPEYSFMISCQAGRYSASAQRMCGTPITETIVSYDAFDSFDKAKQACKDFYKSKIN
jgi:hypothetical protein